MKQLVQSVKGTRDFYPEDFAVRAWLYDKIQNVSQRFGYCEFDGPMLEYLDLYSDKTSEEILKEQVFSLKDRDGRDLVLRPEITPTFARMVAQKSRQLLQPIRWFSFARSWRYEQPQKGRGREFFQWEINLLGPETPEADAEILAIAVAFFQSLELSPQQVVIRVSDRSYFDQILREYNISADLYLPLLRIVDRKEKVSHNEFEQMLSSTGLNTDQIRAINEYLANTDFAKSEWLNQVFKALAAYPGALEYIQYDPVITRGFDYYTRTVFEAWDKTGGLKRALFGGGRFDNLTENLGGERIPGVGMAPGDMPVMVILEQFGKIPELKPFTPNILVSVFDHQLRQKSTEIASMLRSDKLNCELWIGDEKLEKQLRFADRRGIKYLLICGPEEAEKSAVVLKDMRSGEQTQVKLSDLTHVLHDKLG